MSESNKNKKTRGEKKPINIAIGANLKQFRVQNGMREKDFCRAYEEVFKPNILPLSTLSSYESGSRAIPHAKVIMFSEMLNISPDELLAYPAEKKKKPLLYLDDYLCVIDDSDLLHYDGKPVFITYNDGSHKYGEWGIYDKQSDIFSLTGKGRFVRRNKKYQYYACTPDFFPQPKSQSRKRVRCSR